MPFQLNILGTIKKEKRPYRISLLFFSFKIYRCLFENQTDAEADVVLEKSAEDRGVIDLNGAEIDFIVRDFVTAQLEAHEQVLDEGFGFDCRTDGRDVDSLGGIGATVDASESDQGAIASLWS